MILRPRPFPLTVSRVRTLCVAQARPLAGEGGEAGHRGQEGRCTRRATGVIAYRARLRDTAGARDEHGGCRGRLYAALPLLHACGLTNTLRPVARGLGSVSGVGSISRRTKGQHEARATDRQARRDKGSP